MARRLYSVDQCYELEQQIYDRQDISEYELMRRAGQAAFDRIKQLIDPDRPWVVFCGPGNNGGDGYVIASHAIDAGMNVHLCEVGGRSNHTGPAAIAREKALNKPDGYIEWPINKCPKNAVIIDAIFGIGIDGTPRGMAADVIDWINYYTAGHTVICVDVPSGFNVNTGMTTDHTVIADYTITLLSNKKALYTGQAKDVTGQVVFDDLNLASQLYATIDPDLIKLDEKMARAPLPGRPANAHKGDFGHAMVIGGQHQNGQSMGGAVIMAGMAANKMGTGRITIATDGNHILPILAHDSSITPIALSVVDDVTQHLAGKKAILLGPGLGQSDWAKGIWQATMDYAHDHETAMVMDADGLNLLAENDIEHNNRFTDLPNTVLTPHPGEAARLLNITIDDVQADRETAVRRLSDQYNACVVLKGAGSLITAPDQPIFLNPTGNAGMATGGTGDILAGMIAGLMAQGVSPIRAAKSGAYFHGLAGDHAANTIGQMAMTAMDVIDHLPGVVKK